jgi:hypothetical protein
MTNNYTDKRNGSKELAKKVYGALAGSDNDSRVTFNKIFFYYFSSCYELVVAVQTPEKYCYCIAPENEILKSSKLRNRFLKFPIIEAT